MCRRIALRCRSARRSTCASPCSICGHMANWSRRMRCAEGTRKQKKTLNPTHWVLILKWAELIHHVIQREPEGCDACRLEVKVWTVAGVCVVCVCVFAGRRLSAQQRNATLSRLHAPMKNQRARAWRLGPHLVLRNPRAFPATQLRDDPAQLGAGDERFERAVGLPDVDDLQSFLRRIAGVPQQPRTFEGLRAFVRTMACVEFSAARNVGCGWHALCTSLRASVYAG